MIVKDPAQALKLAQVTGPEVLPITLRLRVFGDETVLQEYNNLLLEDLIQKISDITSFPVKQILLKVIEENLIRRIDRQIYNQNDPNKKNTLKDIKLTDNAALMVDMKSEEELAKETDQEYVKTNPHTLDYVNVDDTENIRTVIVNTEYDKENFERY